MLSNEAYKFLSEKFDFVEVKDSYIAIPSDKIEEVAKCAKEECGYDYLEMVTASDHNEIFIMTYTFINIAEKSDIAIKCEVSRDNPEIPTLANIWVGANFQEREIFDLMGINFINHPNMKRIVLWDGFEGHPQRKDYKNVA